MSQDNKARLKQWLESGEARLHPLTFPQRELWEASPVSPPDVLNHICAFINVRGMITLEDCQVAIQRVVDRHDVLRLSFLPGKSQPLQLVRSSGTAHVNLRELEPDERQGEGLEERMREIFRKPFDLLRGPLYRVEILRRGPDDVVLVLAIHHAIADGWSLGVFVQDLCAAYLQKVRGRDGALPAVPLSYAEWSASERSSWDAAKLADRAQFWKANLGGIPRLWDRPPVDKATPRTLRQWVTSIPEGLTAGVREIARRTSTTLFSTLLTGFQAALAEWSGRSDVIVGTPVANRTRQAVRETMGYFSDVVPLYGHVEAGRSFAERVRTVHESAVESFANAMPFAELSRALGQVPSPNHNPVFDVRFALQNHPIPAVSLPSLSMKLTMRSTGTARFDLGCEITEDGAALEIVWLSRPELFSEQDVEDLDRIYQGKLAEACGRSESRTAVLTETLK